MASSDDDFPLITDTTTVNHRSNPTFHHHAPPPQSTDHDYTNGGAYISPPMPIAMPYDHEPDLHRVKGVRTEKWNSDELSDGGSYKKPKVMTMTSSSGGGNGEYRKDREEWSDSAIEC
ncbi:hypothetical protein Tco_0642287, partial [Tanacetum coccineum]